MIKSLANYSKYFSKAIFNEQSRILLNIEWQRYKGSKEKFIEAKEVKVDEYNRSKALCLAIEWLLRAQYKMLNYGFGSYRLTKGWTASYPETTGYIISTLLNYAKKKNESQICECCYNGSNWLIEIQKSTGGWQGQTVNENRPEVVFNTGQIIRGLIDVYEYSKDEKYLESAIKAGNWLCSIQEENGSWVKNAFMNVARVYDSYVAAPLVKLFLITDDIKYKNAAIKNIEWIINNKQHSNGWFEDCDNTIKHNDRPILHTIAYTIDGLIETGILLNREDFIAAAKKPANKLLDIYSRDGYLYGRYNKDWEGSEDVILTGCAQMSINWMKLFKHTHNKAYLNAALQMNRQLFWVQWSNDCPVECARGAISGSFPIWGKYEPFSFPNWATKYFVDAILLEIELTEGTV